MGKQVLLLPCTPNKYPLEIRTCPRVRCLSFCAPFQTEQQDHSAVPVYLSQLGQCVHVQRNRICLVFSECACFLLLKGTEEPHLQAIVMQPIPLLGKPVWDI
jgi:hypothetical protein